MNNLTTNATNATIGREHCAYRSALYIIPQNVWHVDRRQQRAIIELREQRQRLVAAGIKAWSVSTYSEKHMASKSHSLRAPESSQCLAHAPRLPQWLWIN
jgi:hypothetical protein